MISPEFDKRLAEAAEKYATGNHRASFPDSFELRAFEAGAHFARAECEDQLRIAVDALEEIFRTCGWHSCSGDGIALGALKKMGKR